MGTLSSEDPICEIRPEEAISEEIGDVFFGFTTWSDRKSRGNLSDVNRIPVLW